MDHSFDIPVVAGALPQEDPRIWLTSSIVRAGTTPPTRVIAARSRQQLVAVDPEPDAGWIAALDEAFLADGAEWVGGYGTAIMKRDGGRLLTCFARIRWSDGTVWLRSWLCLPGVPLTEDDAETYEGPRTGVPDWLQRLFPTPRGLQVKIQLRPWSDLAWLERYGVRAPDALHPVEENASLSDVALAAAHHLEARVVVTQQIGPAVIGWMPDGIALWWQEGLEEARAIGRRIAKRGACAAGLFGLGEERSGKVHLLGLVVEAPGNEHRLWMRRFILTDDGAAKWTEPAGALQEPAPTLGWFDR